MRRMMTAALAGLLMTATASVAVAMDETEELTKKYDAKVSEAWFTEGGWTDDYEAAKKQSQETGKPIIAYFTRSYSP